MNRFYFILLVVIMSCGTSTMSPKSSSVSTDSTYYDETIHILIDSSQIIENTEEVGVIEEKIIKKPIIPSKSANSRINKEEFLMKRTDSILYALEKRVIEVRDSLKEFRSLKK